MKDHKLEGTTTNQREASNMKDYQLQGTPEYYLLVPRDAPVDTDAINITIERASAIVTLLWSQFEGREAITLQLNDQQIASALFAVEGLLNQVRALSAK